MYLFVFVFLVMSVVGLYTQVYALQASKMYEKQTGAAQIMLTWHEGMKKHVKNQYDELTATSYTRVQNGTGCYLTSVVDWPNINSGLPANQQCSSYVASDDDLEQLMPGYNIGLYRFRTIVYKPANVSCSPSCAYDNKVILITYIKANQTVAGFGVNEISLQLRKIGVDSLYIGFVDSAGTIVKTLHGTQYDIPTVNGRPNPGSLVLVSLATPP